MLVFEYSDYKVYLQSFTQGPGSRGRGEMSRLARAAGCNLTYLSQVLNHHAHLSLEQAEALNEYLGHSAEESDFFLLLVQRARAGAVALRRRFDSQIAKLTEARRQLKARVDIKSPMTVEQQAHYYSSWHYSAVHVLITIPQLRTREVIANALNLSLQRVDEILKFLTEVSLVDQTPEGFTPLANRIFLPHDSPLIGRHHINWRLRAVDAINVANSNHLHFSGVFSLSRSDVELIRNQVLAQISKARAIVKDSKEEELHCFNVDFFKVT